MMIVLDNHFEVGVVSLLPRYLKLQIQDIPTHVAVDGNVAFQRTSMLLAKIVSFTIMRMDKGV